MYRFALALILALTTNFANADDIQRFPENKSGDVYGFSQVLYDVYFKFRSNRELDSYLRELKLKRSEGKLVDHKTAQKVMDELEEPFYRGTGGSVAVTLAGMGKMGSDVYFMGTTVDDEYGRKYKEEMEKYDVKIDLEYVQTDGITGTVIVLLSPKGERTMLAHPGPNQFIDNSRINPDVLQNYKLAYTDGYMWQLPGNEATTKRIFDEARGLGVQTAFSYGDAYIVNKYRKKMLAITKEVDVVFSNEAQALALFQTKDIESAAKSMQKIANVAVITLAERGAYIISKDEIIKLDALEVEKVVDKTGAGDQFAAGFLYGYTQNKPLRECGELGMKAAAEVLQHMGAKPTL